MNERRISCADCGRPLGVLREVDASPRIPCPACGSTKRFISLPTFRAVVIGRAHASAVHEREGRRIGYHESERQGRVSSASEQKDGALSFSLEGTPPQGEEDTLATCRILVRTLNQLCGEAAPWQAWP